MTLIVLFCLSQSLVIKIINYHLNTTEYSTSAHWENIDHRRGVGGIETHLLWGDRELGGGGFEGDLAFAVGLCR